MELLPRKRFPVGIYVVSCPSCGETAHVLAEGILWVCACGARGYYEQPQGRVFPNATYSGDNGNTVNP